MSLRLRVLGPVCRGGQVSVEITWASEVWGGGSPKHAESALYSAKSSAGAGQRQTGLPDSRRYVIMESDRVPIFVPGDAVIAVYTEVLCRTTRLERLSFSGSLAVSLERYRDTRGSYLDEGQHDRAE